MWKGRLNGKNSKLHIPLQAPNQITGSGNPIHKKGSSHAFCLYFSEQVWKA